MESTEVLDPYSLVQTDTKHTLERLLGLDMFLG